MRQSFFIQFPFTDKLAYGQAKFNVNNKRYIQRIFSSLVIIHIFVHSTAYHTHSICLVSNYHNNRKYTRASQITILFIYLFISQLNLFVFDFLSYMATKFVDIYYYVLVMS